MAQGQNMNIQIFTGTVLATVRTNTNNFLNTIDKTNIVSINFITTGTAAAPRYTIEITFII